MMVLLAKATDRELARMASYLKEENKILRTRLGKQVHVTPKERARLLRFGRHLGTAIYKVVTIVSPSTLLRWLREERNAKPQKRGRPRTADQRRRLILRMARENDWGSTRIMGELKKLGITPPSRNTVKNILKKAGLEPGPNRGEGTWDEFLTRHAVSLWQCDFFSRRVLTLGGIRQAFVLALIHVQTRRVILSPATFKPDAAWVSEQAETFVEQARADGLPVARLMRDRDGAFSQAFDEALRRQRVRVLPAPRAKLSSEYSLSATLT